LLVLVRWKKAGKTALSKRGENGCKKRKNGAVCGRCAAIASRLRVEPLVLQKGHLSGHGKCFLQQLFTARFWRFFCFFPYKKSDKTAANGEQQASKIMGSKGIFLFWYQGTTTNIKKDRELP